MGAYQLPGSRRDTRVMVVESRVGVAGCRGSANQSAARTPGGPATICTVVDTQTDYDRRVVVLDESLPELRALAKARAASERADAAHECARQQLREAVLAAISAGISPTCGLSPP